MPVFRVEKNKNVTIMSNHHLRNRDMSLKAKGERLVIYNVKSAGGMGLFPSAVYDAENKQGRKILYGIV